nr:EGF-like domain-containing protein comC [Ciona intestinalis]|eukprot:XP_002128273.1 EGF-like domain-containing protein comC [Ciona intestinalis]
MLVVMNGFSYLLLLFGVVSTAGLECRNCIANDNYRGEAGLNDDCYDNPLNVQTQTCTGHCYTRFSVQDGIPTSVSRRCSPASLPTITHLCVVSFGSSLDIATTACSYYCNDGDNCNDLTTRNLITCPNNCGYISKGYCDYFTGNCVCAEGYQGTNCSTEIVVPPIYRSCVQCNGATDESCETNTQGSPCPETTLTQPYCSSSKTSTIDKSGLVIREVVTRGCTARFTYEDECFFSAPNDNVFSSEYTEHTCNSMCDTDNCNTNTPNGVIDGDESKPLYCFQCTTSSESDGSQQSSPCQAQLTRCPSDSTHCVSTVVYYISEITDRNYQVNPSYQLKSINRGCASAPRIKGCESYTIGSLNAFNVTCQESCQTDGCNTGWPSRPRCSICTSAVTGQSNNAMSSDYDSCLINPPLGTSCPFPYQSYCVASVTKSGSGNSGFMARGCSSYNIGNACKYIGDETFSYQVCNRSCTTNNCNMGDISSGSAALTHHMWLPAIPLLCLLILRQ